MLLGISPGTTMKNLDHKKVHEVFNRIRPLVTWPHVNRVHHMLWGGAALLTAYMYGVDSLLIPALEYSYNTNPDYVISVTNMYSVYLQHSQLDSHSPLQILFISDSLFQFIVLLLLFSCYVLFDSFATPVDCSPPDSSVHGISQGRILEWLPFPSPGYLPDPQIELMSPALTGRFFTTEPPGKTCLSLPRWRFTYM